MDWWSYATELKFTAESASVVGVPDGLMATLVMFVVLNCT